MATGVRASSRHVRLALALAVASLALAIRPATAQEADATIRTWRLAGIYLGETAATPAYPLNTRLYATPRSASAAGGEVDVAVHSPSRGRLFAQRFSWRFADDVRTLRSGQRYGISYALEGERPTTNGNSAALHGSGSASRLDQRYFPPERRTGLTQHGVDIQAAEGTTVALDGASPASRQATFSIGPSNPHAGPEWAAFWMTLNNFNGEEPGGWQFFEIHYVFTTEPPGSRGPLASSELPPGTTSFGVEPTPAAPAPPPTAGPSPDTVLIPRPEVDGVEVDWCASYATDCGQRGADRYCSFLGLGPARSWRWEYTDRTIALGDHRVCASAGRCGALRDVACERRIR